VVQKVSNNEGYLERSGCKEVRSGGSGVETGKKMDQNRGEQLTTRGKGSAKKGGLRGMSRSKREGGGRVERQEKGELKEKVREIQRKDQPAVARQAYGSRMGSGAPPKGDKLLDWGTNRRLGGEGGMSSLQRQIGVGKKTVLWFPVTPTMKVPIDILEEKTTESEG